MTVVLLLAVLAARGQSGTLPVFYIDTQDKKPITSKTVYVAGTYYIADSLYPSQNVGSAENPLALEIRGRGHSSWKGEKKPYKIKLGEKAPLLGMNKHKHWALLKFNEPTIAGLQLGRLMDMDWTPSTRAVEVVLNGEYIGLYLLTETNRIGKNRVDIYEQPNWNEDESTIPYGWLVEVDNYVETGQVVIRENSKWRIRLTCHSPDSLSAAQKRWLTDEFQKINTAIYAEDKVNSTWEELVNVDEMARFFIVQEVLDNSDGFHGSFYLHKDSVEDARWMAGPLWDLSCGYREKTDYTFMMKTSYIFTPHWIGELIKDEDFCSAVREVWDEFYPGEVQTWMDYIDEQLLRLGEAFEHEKKRWTYSNKDSIAVRSAKLKSALLANLEWFNDNLPVGVAASVADLSFAPKRVVRVEYINMAGMRSPRPWKGMNIKETTYADGSTATSKVVVKG